MTKERELMDWYDTAIRDAAVLHLADEQTIRNLEAELASMRAKTLEECATNRGPSLRFCMRGHARRDPRPPARRRPMAENDEFRLLALTGECWSYSCRCGQRLTAHTLIVIGRHVEDHDGTCWATCPRCAALTRAAGTTVRCLAHFEPAMLVSGRGDD